MPILLLIWLAVGIGLVWVGSQKPGSAGLPLAYFVGLSLIHVPGAILHLDTDLDTITTATVIGFEQTIIGMVTFLGGVIIARLSFSPSQSTSSVRALLPYVTANRPSAFNRLAFLYMVIGAVTYFLLLPFAGWIPSGTAIVAPLGSLLIVGACLRIWVAKEEGSRVKFWSTVAILPTLPLSTLIQGGFIGFGTYWAVAVITFLFAQSKWKSGYLLLAPAVFFVGLSVFVNYMAARDDFRRLVWIEQASVGDRLQRVVDVFQNFQFLDFSNSQHREAIDGRLNQNVLIGAAAEQLESGQVQYAAGETVVNIIVALVPRALWPDKPAVGGGGNVVSDFTGIEFAEGTSVGAGQVFEFYVNFGTLGVVGGFLLYGWLIGRMDLLVKIYLERGDQRRFVFWFLICLALLQPGGNVVEIAVSAIGSAVAGLGVGRLLRRYGFGRTTGLPQMVAGQR